MTNIDITPEILQAVISEGSNGRLDPIAIAHLMEWAEELVPVETWAEILHNAAAPIDGCWVAYEHAPADMRETARRQARAVLAKLEQDDLITDPLEAAEHQEKVLGITQEQCAAEARAEGQLPPRQWDDLRDVPDDVRWVQDKDGDDVVRDASRRLGWRWPSHGPGLGASALCMTDFSPYTEIVERRP